MPCTGTGGDPAGRYRNWGSRMVAEETDRMIYVPLWLFVLTLCAKCLRLVKVFWQVRCTRKKGRLVIPLSTLYLGLISTAIGLLYYCWMREPVGVVGHVTTLGVLTNNIWYKRKEVCGKR